MTSMRKALPSGELFYTRVDSPVGPLLLTGDGEALHFIDFAEGVKPFEVPPAWRRDAAPFAEAAHQLAEYFDGERADFDLPLAPEGTPFQLRVWAALRTIPYGETLSYGELARRIGSPRAVRAVGAANGANPLPIVLPCHRVIGANGKLVGYGGGLPIKRRLLAIEAEHASLLFRGAATRE